MQFDVFLGIVEKLKKNKEKSETPQSPVSIYYPNLQLCSVMKSRDLV